MNRIFFSLIGVLALLAASDALALPVEVKTNNFNVKKTPTRIFLYSRLYLDNLNKGSNREEWITPVIKNGADSIELSSIVIAGKNRYNQAQRHRIPEKKNIRLYKLDSSNMRVNYFTNVKYNNWMEGAKLYYRVDHKGCCGDDYLPSEIIPYNTLWFDSVGPVFNPVFNWISPKAEAVKQREIRGQAYIDFPANQTVIYPDYRRNEIELSKIQATIDSVREDKDVTINTLSIKGFASPEGSWNNNVRLAKGRIAALKSYVERLYHFSPRLIATSYIPEDWDGLREYILNSNITNREGILRIIDSKLDADPKNAKIEKNYPKEYKFLLDSVYPSLRRSDYRIEYTIRKYTDVSEIIEIAKTRPQNLSLQELFLAAQMYEPGSEEYNNLFETAVRFYPDSEIANLNAANVAMSRGDLVKAENNLKKAGDNPEAIYARGVFEALSGNYDSARDFFRLAARLKVADAPEALEQIDAITQ